jgi:outer membrane biosynthesis protein TonB
MLLVVAIVCGILSFACSIWALVIIFKRSVIGGLLTLFLGLPMLYYLVTGWGKEGQDIKKPFFLSILLWGIAAGVAMAAMGDMSKEMLEQMQEQQASTRPKGPAPAPRKPEPAPAPKPAAPIQVSAPAAPAAPATPATPAPQVAAPPPAPVEKPAAVAPAAPAPRAAASEPPAPRASAPAPAPAKEAPRTLGTATACVYKPVMTDEEIARCR